MPLIHRIRAHARTHARAYARYVWKRHFRHFRHGWDRYVPAEISLFFDRLPFADLQASEISLQTRKQLITYQLQKTVLFNENKYTGTIQTDLSLDMSPMKAQNMPDKPHQGWLSTLDMRTAVGRDMRGRYAEVCNDLGGADSLSYSQRSLVERALWIEYWVAQQERVLADGGEADIGRMTQATNSLLGLYRTLGIERRQRDVTDLKTYLAQKASG